MKKWFILWLLLALCLSGCAGETAEPIEEQTQKTAEEIKEETIAAYLHEMTTEEKVGQLLMADFRTNADGSAMTQLSKAAEQAIQTYHLGGVILFAENLDTQAQTTELIGQMQAAAKLPLFIGLDEEGGLVSRLGKSNIAHEQQKTAGEMTAPAEAEAAGSSIGTTLAALGVNVDFAPVADVNTNPDNPVIGIRAYSDNPQKAAEMVAAFVKGLQKTGVSAAVKHFPGHGDTETDSHYGEVFVTHDLERLTAVEFVPFAAGIAADVDFVMLGHIKLPQVTTDALPASLSAQGVALLREELGYQGVAITDAMNMQAITEYYGVGESAVMAIAAGVDIVLMPADLEQAYAALIEGVKEGRISEQRLTESLERILRLKYDKGMLKTRENS